MSEFTGGRGPGAKPPTKDGHGEQPLGGGAGSVQDQRRRAAAQISTRLKAWRRAGEAGSPAAGAKVPGSTGAPLGGDVRRKMEPKLGADLSSVRVHTGGDSAEAAKGLNARAFTVGEDVHFGAGQFAPGSHEGDKLLAHELTHVVQGQRSGVQRKAEHGDEHAGEGGEVSQPHEPAEQEADAKGDEIADALHGKKEHGDQKAAPQHGGSAKAAPQASEAKAGPEQKAPAPISAKLSSVAFKVYRAGGGAGGAAAGAAAGAAPGAAGTSGAAGSKPGAPPPDPLKDFHDALSANSRGAVVTQWSKLAAADKQKLTQKDVLAAFDVSPGTALDMMKAIAADFSMAAYMTKFLAISNPSQWSLQLNQAGLWDSFIKSPPKHEAITKDQAAALAGFMVGTKSRDVFEKVYPKLQDATYAATYLKATAWASPDITRLYNALSGLPVAHVQASSGGFYLGTQENLDGKGFKPLGFAWQQGDKMVLPKSSSNATGGGTQHDMTGGTSSGAANVAGTAAGGQVQSHFVGSATHEVGHAVSNKCAGDAWATTRNAFAPLAPDPWSKALFDEAAVKADLDAKLKAKTIKQAMAPADARAFLLGKITGTEALPAKWSAPDAIAFATQHLSAQPLYAYWNAKKSFGDTYQLPATNVVGSKAYAYLTRFNNQTCTYNATTYSNKVSWYSVSSPAEWFAENYSHYYRLNKNHPEADVKKYFDDLDTKFSATAPGGGMTPGAAAPGADAQAQGAGGGQAQGGGQGGGAQQAPAPPADLHRMQFAW